MPPAASEASAVVVDLLLFAKILGHYSLSAFIPAKPPAAAGAQLSPAVVVGSLCEAAAAMRTTLGTPHYESRARLAPSGRSALDRATTALAGGII